MMRLLGSAILPLSSGFLLTLTLLMNVGKGMAQTHLAPNGALDLETLRSMQYGLEQFVDQETYLTELQKRLPPPSADEPDYLSLLRSADPDQFKECSRLVTSLQPGRRPTRAQKVEYDNSCVSKRDQLEEAFRAVLDSVVGVLEMSDTVNRHRIHCSAFRIAPNLVVTARHCLDHFVMRVSGDLKCKSIRQRMTFYLAAQPAKAIRIVDVGENSFYSKPEHRVESQGRAYHKYDYVFLMTEGAELPLAQFNVGVPKKFQPLVIYGVQRFALDIVFPEGLPTGAEKSRWVDAIRWDSAPSCVVGGLDSICMHHGCLTEKGNSGGAIFGRLQSGELLLLGIHLKNARDENMNDPRYDCPVPTDFLSRGNSGLWMKDHFRADLLKARENFSSACRS